HHRARPRADADPPPGAGGRLLPLDRDRDRRRPHHEHAHHAALSARGLCGPRGLLLAGASRVATPRARCLLATMTNASDPPGAAEVRLDKWLWAARCFKTRSAASDACAAGHVKVNGASAKAARPVRSGDRIEAVTPGGPRILEVAALSDRRGPATVARTLYVDH